MGNEQSQGSDSSSGPDSSISNQAAYNNGFGMGYSDARDGSGDNDPLMYVVSACTKDGQKGYTKGYDKGTQDEAYCSGKNCDSRDSGSRDSGSRSQENERDNSGNDPH